MIGLFYFYYHKVQFSHIPECFLQILFLFLPETDEIRLDCVSPEPLVPAAPVTLPEILQDIESEDSLEEEETKSEDPINEEETVPKDSDAVDHQPSKTDDEKVRNNCDVTENIVKPSTENMSSKWTNT